MDPSKVVAFVVASTILLVVPGPAVTYVIARSFQLVVLGTIFVAVGLVTEGLYAVTAAAAGRRFGANSPLLRHRTRIAGFVYLGLGALAIAIPGKRT